MQRTIQTIEFDFTDHFGTPYKNMNEAAKQAIIADAKNVLWDANTQDEVINQVEITYGFMVKNIVTDIVLEVA